MYIFIVHVKSWCQHFIYASVKFENNSLNLRSWVFQCAFHSHFFSLSLSHILALFWNFLAFHVQFLLLFKSDVFFLIWLLLLLFWAIQNLRQRRENFRFNLNISAQNDNIILNVYVFNKQKWNKIAIQWMTKSWDMNTLDDFKWIYDAHSTVRIYV